MDTAMEFLKLEKVEFSGIKGKALSSLVVQMFEQFNTEFKIFSDKGLDCLDPMEAEFMADYEKFSQSVEDMDRRLAAMVCQGFDDASGTEAAFKLIAIFGTLLERPLVKRDFDAKYPILIEMMDAEMDLAKEMYDEHMAEFEQGHHKIHKNMPIVTGELKWSAELRQRITYPVDSLRMVDHPWVERNSHFFIYMRSVFTFNLRSELIPFRFSFLQSDVKVRADILLRL